MKFTHLALLLLAALPLAAQTPPPPNTLAFLDQVQGRSKTATPMVLVVINGKITDVQLDPSLVLNLTTNPPTLSAAAAKPVILPIPQIETFQITTAATTLPLKFTPATNTLSCYRNGMSLSAGFDYTQTAALLTFTTGTNSNAPQVGDLFTCAYYH